MALQKTNNSQLATSTQRNSAQSRSVGAVSTKATSAKAASTHNGRSQSARRAADTFETSSQRSSRSGSSTRTLTTAAGTQKKSSTKRKATVAIVGATTGAAVLGFAGYGIYAAAPHIAAGITAAFAVPAVHFGAIGLAAGIAVALIGVGVVVGIREYKAYKASKNQDAFDVESLQKRGPRQLSAENLAKLAASSSEAVDSIDGWRKASSEKATSVKADNDDISAATPKPVVAETETDIVSPTPKPSLASGLADALKAKQLREEQAKAEATGAKRPAPPAVPVLEKALRFVSFDKTKVGSDAAANWFNLDKSGHENTKGWKDFYAGVVLDYSKSTNDAERTEYFNELRQALNVGEAADLFPEAVDEKTFAAALPKLEPLAQTWVGRRANA